MEYTVVNKDSYKLHMIKTNKFKTIKFRLFFRSKIKKEEITLRNFLMDILTYSTLKYPTRKELVKASQDLYAISIYSKGYRLGNFQTINFFLSLLNEKYTESGMLEESIKLLSEVLYNPNVQDGEFDKESFDIIYKNNKKMIESIKESTSKYSLIRMLENMGDDLYSYREYGYIEDLEKINRKNLYDYYLNFLENSDLDIYVIGDFDQEKLTQLMDKYFKSKTVGPNEKIEYMKHEMDRLEPKIVKEVDSINQSKLSIGCKLMDLTDRERNYVLTIYNLLLGATADSRFFKNIREKHSICYTISSSLDKIDNLLFIKAGISKNNFDLCVNLIKQEMKEIEDGNITDNELQNAKNTYISLLEEIMDNDESIIDTYVATDILGIGNVEERKEQIKTVTKEEVINLSKKIKMDTIYLLEGSDIDDNN